MQDFRELQVWQKAHELAVQIYQVTASFPKEEVYGLTSQIRRASVSIPANIAEGCGRSGKPEFAHFLRIAMGSANEIEFLLMLCRDVHLLRCSDWEDFTSKLIEVRRMLVTLEKRVKSQS